MKYKSALTWQEVSTYIKFLLRTPMKLLLQVARADLWLKRICHLGSRPFWNQAKIIYKNYPVRLSYSF